MNSDPNAAQTSQFASQRHNMVERQLRTRQITEPAVLEAFEQVPRHRFVPSDWMDAAYDDRPLPIGHQQTISQPYVVAYMLQLAQLTPGCHVLDCGGGSGYQAALLSAMGCQVLSVEIVPELAEEEGRRLAELHYDNVRVESGDCLQVIQQEEPFDAIIAAAARPTVPQEFLEHLALNGRLVMPVGRDDQELIVFHKQADGSLRRTSHGSVAFVPFTGENS